jgi:hypothetical protein
MYNENTIEDIYKDMTKDEANLLKEIEKTEIHDESHLEIDD